MINDQGAFPFHIISDATHCFLDIYFPTCDQRKRPSNLIFRERGRANKEMKEKNCFVAVPGPE